MLGENEIVVGPDGDEGDDGRNPIFGLGQGTQDSGLRLPPILGDPQEFKPEEGETLNLESNADQFGAAGAPPEILRIYQNADRQHISDAQIERAANPEQRLPAWIARLLGSSGVETSGLESEGL